MDEDADALAIPVVSNFCVHTARTVKVAGINAFVVAPFLLLLFWPRWWVLFVLVVTAVVLWLLERFGYTPIVMLRTIISRIAGSFVARCRKVGSRRIWM